MPHKIFWFGFKCAQTMDCEMQSTIIYDSLEPAPSDMFLQICLGRRRNHLLIAAPSASCRAKKYALFFDMGGGGSRISIFVKFWWPFLWTNKLKTNKNALRHVTRSSEMNIATNINNHLRSIDPSVSQSVSLSASWNMRDHRLQCYMTHCQMLGKFEYTLPAKFWRLVGCTEMLSW